MIHCTQLFQRAFKVYGTRLYLISRLRNNLLHYLKGVQRAGFYYAFVHFISNGRGEVFDPDYHFLPGCPLHNFDSIKPGVPIGTAEPKMCK